MWGVRSTKQSVGIIVGGERGRVESLFTKDAIIGDVVPEERKSMAHDIIPSAIQNVFAGGSVEQNREILEIILQYMKENCVAAYDEKSGKGLIRRFS